MRPRFKAYSAAAFGLSLAVPLFGGWLGRPAYGQADEGTGTIVSGTVLDLNGQPAAGVLMGYIAAEEIRADNGPRRLVVVPNGRRQVSEEQRQATTVPSTGSSVRREGHATITATQTVSLEETISADTLRRLGLATASDMAGQLPSNVGTFQLDGNADGNWDWIIHPSGIAYVDGMPVGETDNAGAFSVELPGGGTYVITARIESANSRGYGSRQPVVVETGQMLHLAPIMLSFSTYPGCCPVDSPAQ